MSSTLPSYLNPFTCNVDTLCSLLISLLDDGVSQSARQSMFRWRAVALVSAVAPVLVWVRDSKGVRIDFQQSHFTMELPNLQALTARKLFRVRASVTRVVTEIPVADMPEALVRPVQAYLEGLPAYDPGLPQGDRRAWPAGEQHSYALFHLAQACSQDAAANPCA